MFPSRYVVSSLLEPRCRAEASQGKWIEQQRAEHEDAEAVVYRASLTFNALYRPANCHGAYT